MLHTNMELPVLPVQLATVEAAGTISATKVGLGQSWGFLSCFISCHTFLTAQSGQICLKKIVSNIPPHHGIMYFPSLSCHDFVIAILFFMPTEEI